MMNFSSLNAAKNQSPKGSKVAVKEKDFEFIDFEPSSSLARRAKERLSRIFGESPSDSSARAFLRKTRDGFEGRLQVSSVVGTFMAHVVGDDPLSVVDSLSRKVRSQLRLWKRSRSLIAADQ